MKRGIGYRISTFSNILKKLTEEVELKRKLNKSVWFVRQEKIEQVIEQEITEGMKGLVQGYWESPPVSQL